MRHTSDSRTVWGVADQMDFIGTDEAGAALGVTARRVVQLITSGKLPARTFGGSYLIKRSDLSKVKVRKVGRPKIKRSA